MLKKALAHIYYNFFFLSSGLPTPNSLTSQPKTGGHNSPRACCRLRVVLAGGGGEHSRDLSSGKSGWSPYEVHFGPLLPIYFIP